MADENPRQEVEIKLGERTFTVRPTFQIIAAIENGTGLGCVTLALKIGRAQASLSELAVALAAMVRDQKGPTLDEIGAMLVEDGVQQYYDPVSEFLLRALKGNKEHARIAKEAAAKAETDRPPTAE